MIIIFMVATVAGGSSRNRDLKPHLQPFLEAMTLNALRETRDQKHILTETTSSPAIKEHNISLKKKSCFFISPIFFLLHKEKNDIFHFGKFL